MKRNLKPTKKPVTMRGKIASLLVGLAYRIDPTSEDYMTYIMDKVISHSILGGALKIDWIDPEELIKK